MTTRNIYTTVDTLDLTLTGGHPGGHIPSCCCGGGITPGAQQSTPQDGMHILKNNIHCSDTF